MVLLKMVGLDYGGSFVKLIETIKQGLTSDPVCVIVICLTNDFDLQLFLMLRLSNRSPIEVFPQYTEGCVSN